MLHRSTRRLKTFYPDHSLMRNEEALILNGVGNVHRILAEGEGVIDPRHYTAGSFTPRPATP